MKKHIINLNDTPFVKFTFLFKNITIKKYIDEIRSFMDSFEDFKSKNQEPIFFKQHGFDVDFEYKKEKDLKMIKVGSFFYKETKDELLIRLTESGLFGVYLKNKKNNETYVVSNVPLHDSLYIMKSLYVAEQQLTISRPIQIIKNNEIIMFTSKNLKSHKILNLSIEKTSITDTEMLKNQKNINLSNEKNVKNQFIKKAYVFLDENEKKIYELELKNCQFKKILINEDNALLKIKLSSETLKIISSDLSLVSSKKVRNILLPSGLIDNDAWELLNQTLSNRKELDFITEDKSKINIITIQDILNAFQEISRKSDLFAMPNKIINFHEGFLNTISKPTNIHIPKEKSNLFNVYSYEDNINDPYYDTLKFENIAEIWESVKHEIVIPHLENKKNPTKKPNL